MKEAVKSFYEGIKSSEKSKLVNPVDKEAIRVAVNCAYGDAKRTFKGVGEHKTDKEQALNDLNREFKKFFENDAPRSQEEFNTKHNELCECWTRHFQDKLGIYGKAQKIVNMTFKYLYCCKNIEGYEEHFRFCHMPLDYFTLEWFKRTTGNKVKFDTWSNMPKDSYLEITEMIISELKNNDKGLPTEPLLAEFIIWPRIQKELAAEEFWFALKEDINDNDKKEFKKKSLEEKIGFIKEALNKHTVL